MELQKPDALVDTSDHRDVQAIRALADTLARDAARLDAVRRTTLLDSPVDEAFDRLARLAASTLRAPVALVTLLDGDRQFFKATVGLPEPWATRRQRPLTKSFCHYVVALREPLIIPDTRAEPLVADHPGVHEFGVGAYLGVPIITSDGHALGTFSVLDFAPRSWSAEDVQNVRDLTAAVVTEIELRVLTRAAAARAEEEERARRGAEALHRFQGLVDGVDIILWEMDVATWQFTFVNQRAERMLGYPVEQWTTQPDFWQSILHPEDRSWAVQFCRDATRDGRNHEFEYRAIAADGRVVWLRDIVRVVSDERGAPTQLRGVMVDVTEQKEAEARKQALLEEQVARTVAETAERRVRDLVEGLNAVVWEADADTWRFSYVSPRAEEILGYPMSRWLEESNFWVQTVHPDDREWAVGLCRNETQACRHHEFEYRAIAADGRVVWLRDVVRVVSDENGQPKQLRGVMVDVTATKRTEAVMAAQNHVLEMIAAGAPLHETLDTLVRLIEQQANGMIMSILLVDADGTRLLLGAAPNLPESYNQALDGIPIDPYIGPCGKAAQLRTQVVSGDVLEDPEWTPEFRALARAHDLRACWSTPINSSGGDVIGTFAIYHREPRIPTPRDQELISLAIHLAGIAIERRRAEEALRAAKESAERADRAKGQFLAMMSHELRTPLNAIMGYEDLLEGEVLGPVNQRQRESLGRIRVGAQHLLELISEILSLSRIEAGREELRLQTVDLGALSIETASFVEPLATKRGLRLRLELPDAPLTIVSDPSKLRQILLNLLSNGVKFTEVGEVTLTLTQERDRAILHVRDTGVGIAPENIARIFEPFTQVDQSTSRRAGGTGLGLAVSHGLAELLGGELTVESAVGRGSTFTLRVPLTAPTGQPTAIRRG